MTLNNFTGVMMAVLVIALAVASVTYWIGESRDIKQLNTPTIDKTECLIQDGEWRRVENGYACIRPVAG